MQAKPTDELNQRSEPSAERRFAAWSGSADRPITYRDLHEEAAGMGLCDDFFKVSNINPDAPVECNCKWDAGHEPTCDVVAAHALLAKRQNEKGQR